MFHGHTKFYEDEDKICFEIKNRKLLKQTSLNIPDLCNLKKIVTRLSVITACKKQCCCLEEVFLAKVGPVVPAEAHLTLLDFSAVIRNVLVTYMVTGY